MLKFHTYFTLLLTKKQKKKTDYAIHLNDVATLLTVLLLLQLSLQIKNKQKKAKSFKAWGILNVYRLLSKAVCAAFLVAQTFL